MTEEKATESMVGDIGLTDAELAQQMRDALEAGHPVCVVVNAYTCALFRGADGAWGLIGRGEFANACVAVALKFTRSSLISWARTDSAQPYLANPAALSIIRPRGRDIQQWADRARQVSNPKGRRHGEVPHQVRETVAARAAWRCQFAGCGADLRTNPTTGEVGNISYYAHIVASSVDGPRGDTVESPRLAKDADNVMLLCDACHRLIDRIQPDRYTTPVLRKMRENSVREVKRLLDTLQYPAVEPIMFIGNVSGQPHVFSQRAADEALWEQRLRASGNPEYFCYNSYILHDPHSVAYWDVLFAVLDTDVPRLRAKLNGSSSGGGQRPALAVFALHGTSVLILGGRLIGDSGDVHVFQFHRDQVARSPGAQWAWPKSAPEPTVDKYKLDELRGHAGEEEACLIVSLSFGITPDRLPETCVDAAGLALPTVEVRVDDPRQNVIEHPKDLEAFGRRFDDALRLLQDKWRVRRIHLFVGAPVAACFRIGQKMQARNQATFVCHETGRGELECKTFKPTIVISGTAVSLAHSGSSISL